MEKWGDHQEKTFFIDNAVQGGCPESVFRFGKYVIIEKSTLVQTIAVKTNKTIYHFHYSFRRRRLFKSCCQYFNQIQKLFL